ncbi:hypothetical protein H4R35_006389, partial [Dimargaris xerosporica]
IPSLFGIKGVDTNAETYQIFINTCKAVGKTRWPDLLLGLSACVLLEALRLSQQRWGKRHWAIRYVGVGRNAIVVVLFTIISFLVCRNRDPPPLKLTGDVPSGFPKPQVPTLSGDLLSKMASSLVTGFLLCVIEHIAIAKAFARKEQYHLDCNQELISIGMGNICGAFFSAYAVTGSFSRSAVSNQSGSCSPLNSGITAVFVAVAILALPPLFYYIPSACLAAIIITSVSHLISGPKLYWRLWRIDPVDFLASVIAFVVTVFAEVEYGIYAAVGFSVLVMLYRIARPKWRLLAEVKDSFGTYIDRDNPDYPTIDPPPGIVVIRLEESLTFPNMEYFKDRVLTAVYTQTSSPIQPRKVADRNWSDGIDRTLESKIQYEWSRRQVRKRNAQAARHTAIALAPASRTTGPSTNVRFAIDKKEIVTNEPSTVAVLTSVSSKGGANQRRESQVSIGSTNGSTGSQSTHIGRHDAFYEAAANPNDPYERPFLRAVVFDFSAVNNMDTSGLQCLFDLRIQLREYAGCDANSAPPPTTKGEPKDTGDNDRADSGDNFKLGTESDPSTPTEDVHPETSLQSGPPRIVAPNHTFAMHFVSIHPRVLRVLELSGITTDVVPVVPVISTAASLNQDDQNINVDRSSNGDGETGHRPLGAFDYGTDTDDELAKCNRAYHQRKRWSMPLTQAPVQRDYPGNITDESETMDSSDQSLSPPPLVNKSLRWLGSHHLTIPRSYRFISPDAAAPHHTGESYECTDDGKSGSIYRSDASHHSLQHQSFIDAAASPDGPGLSSGKNKSVDIHGNAGDVRTTAVPPPMQSKMSKAGNRSEPIIQEKLRVVHLTIQDAISSILENYDKAIGRDA